MHKNLQNIVFRGMKNDPSLVRKCVCVTILHFGWLNPHSLETSCFVIQCRIP